MSTDSPSSTGKWLTVIAVILGGYLLLACLCALMLALTYALSQNAPGGSYYNAPFPGMDSCSPRAAIGESMDFSAYHSRLTTHDSCL